LFYLIFISPFPAVAFAFILYDVRHDSTFHRWAFRFSAGYALSIAGALRRLDYLLQRQPVLIAETSEPYEATGADTELF
jgi:hypothetical protein